MAPSTSVHRLLDLAEAVAADGVDAHRAAVDALVGWARSRDVTPVLLDILDDRTSPAVVQQRALGRLLVAVAASCGGEGRPPCDPAPAGDRQLTAA